jgi:hypothetical protein
MKYQVRHIAHGLICQSNKLDDIIDYIRGKHFSYPKPNIEKMIQELEHKGEFVYCAQTIYITRQK